MTGTISRIDTAKGSGGQKAPEVPRLAIVEGHLDSKFMGGLKVRILREAGDSRFDNQSFQVKAMFPFAGQTNADFVGNNNDYDGTQKSYGMWFVPPDVGTQVVVIFINGDPSRGFWIGCVPDTESNFMVPGMPSTEFTVEQGTTPSGQPLRAPTSEYNKVIANTDTANASKPATQIPKPTHKYFSQILTNQGLNLDDIRGITTSGARREAPSTVFGISTPGPVDKTPGAPTGKVGLDSLNNNPIVQPISRLGGTTFVMDDGDSGFRRKKNASEGPPDYASFQAGDKSGDPTLPHNEMVRIRTRTGHQILLHNSEDLIYIGNASGTSWIEMSSMGKIDIFASDSVSIHTKADMNFYADRDINMEAGRSINMKSTTQTQLESGGDFNFIVNGNYKVKVTGDYINVVKDFNVSASTSVNLTSVNTNLNSSNNLIITASSVLGINGAGVASKALTTAPKPLPTFNNIYDTNGSQIVSIMKRIPNHEPWPQHENLDPKSMAASQTDITSTSPITFSNGKTTAPDFYLKYTTATDTFNFIPPSSNQSAK